MSAVAITPALSFSLISFESLITTTSSCILAIVLYLALLVAYVQGFSHRHDHAQHGTKSGIRVIHEIAVAGPQPSRTVQHETQAGIYLVGAGILGPKPVTHGCFLLIGIAAFAQVATISERAVAPQQSALGLIYYGFTESQVSYETKLILAQHLYFAQQLRVIGKQAHVTPACHDPHAMPIGL